MKKIFAQPELMVVNVKKNDIVTGSEVTATISGNSATQLAPGQRDIDSWYEGY